MDQPHAPSGLRVIELSVLDAAATRLKCHKTTINQLLPYDEAIMQNYGLVSVAIINHFLRGKVKRARRLTFLVAFLVQLVHRGLDSALENMRAASSNKLFLDNFVKSYLFAGDCVVNIRRSEEETQERQPLALNTDS